MIEINHINHHICLICPKSFASTNLHLFLYIQFLKCSSFYIMYLSHIQLKIISEEKTKSYFWLLFLKMIPVLSGLCMCLLLFCHSISVFCDLWDKFSFQCTKHSIVVRSKREKGNTYNRVSCKWPWEVNLSMIFPNFISYNFIFGHNILSSYFFYFYFVSWTWIICSLIFEPPRVLLFYHVVLFNIYY